MVDVRMLALGLIEFYETNNPFLLAEALELHVLFHPLPDELDGYRLDDTIVLNKGRNYNAQKWILAHEIGHYLLHEDISVGKCYTNRLLIYNKYEKQCDVFASELILHNSKKEAYSLEGLTKEQLAALYEVPVKYIEYAFGE